MKRKVLDIEVDDRHVTNDKIVYEVLKKAEIPLTLNLISHLIDLDKCSTYKALKSLKRFGMVKKSTVQRASYWTTGN